MGRQDGGLRSRYGAELKTLLQSRSHLYRYTPIETGEVSSGVPDARFESKHYQEFWIEFKIWKNKGAMTKDKIFNLLAPAQRGFYLTSGLIGTPHYIFVERAVESSNDFKYFILDVWGSVARSGSLDLAVQCTLNEIKR